MSGILQKVFGKKKSSSNLNNNNASNDEDPGKFSSKHLFCQISSNGWIPIEFFIEMGKKTWPESNETKIIAHNREFGLKFLKDLNTSDWKDWYCVPLLEIFHMAREPIYRDNIKNLLEKKTGKNYDYYEDKWWNWLWELDTPSHPHYQDFKGKFYGSKVSPIFEGYFNRNRKSIIKIEEIAWGGVLQDGIPPLRNPNMCKIGAKEADYLDDENVVFGVVIEGEARCYPKRILAWHEMFVDHFNGIHVCGVYCTLCGTVILYDSSKHDMGTSGFLYRSNKLMYDKATQSLWNTMTGIPVVGSLVDQGIQLKRLYGIVTTSWGEWKKRHPKTTVLTVKTGHIRNYGEGIAYQDYFADDDLMFKVRPSFRDFTLKNKAEVVGLWFPEFPEEPLAIEAEFLFKNKMYFDVIGNINFIVLTENGKDAITSGNRVYEIKEKNQFKEWDANENKLVDLNDQIWIVNEKELHPLDKKSKEHPQRRLPSHRSFWFGWYGAFSKTRLVHLNENNNNNTKEKNERKGKHEKKEKKGKHKEQEKKEE